VVTSKCIKVCVRRHNLSTNCIFRILYYKIVTNIHVIMNYNQVKKPKLVNVYCSATDILTKIRGSAAVSITLVRQPGPSY
jgi:hypothetical protein